jgi:hypothetical protein
VSPTAGTGSPDIPPQTASATPRSVRKIDTPNCGFLLPGAPPDPRSPRIFSVARSPVFRWDLIVAADFFTIEDWTRRNPVFHGIVDSPEILARHGIEPAPAGKRNLVDGVL